MMRIGKHLGSMLMVFFASPALAADVSVSMTADDITNWQNASVAFGRCISDLQLKSDLTVCRGLDQWIALQAGKVQMAAMAAQAAQKAPPAAPPHVPLAQDLPTAPGAGPPGSSTSHPPAAATPVQPGRPISND